MPAVFNGEEAQLPELWRLSLPHEPDSTWDHGRFVPDVLVLQLGVQDLSIGRPSRLGYRATLDRWIHESRVVYPDAWIVLTPSPTVTSSWPINNGEPDWLSERFSEQLALAKGRGDERVRVWRIDPIEGPWGGDYQPTASGQAALARHLASELRQLTGW